MDNIEDVYSNQAYGPFLLYCQSRGYKTMQDLTKCPFSDLAGRSGIAAPLLTRAKMVFSAYCKKHPDILISRPASKPRKIVTGPDPALMGQLEVYFQAHPDTLICLADLVRAMGAKRSDLLKALEASAWCKIVDATTFFYVPLEQP